MRKEYDFTAATPNPYIKRLKKAVTIRLEPDGSLKIRGYVGITVFGNGLQACVSAEIFQPSNLARIFCLEFLVVKDRFQRQLLFRL